MQELPGLERAFQQHYVHNVNISVMPLRISVTSVASVCLIVHPKAIPGQRTAHHQRRLGSTGSLHADTAAERTHRTEPACLSPFPRALPVPLV